MYTYEHIKFLNEFGVLSVSFLRKLDKITHNKAINILKDICEDYDNVYASKTNQICIEGREPEFLKPKVKAKKNRNKRKSKWKDVNKP